MKGAQIIVECLKEQGVQCVFGYPGGTVLSLYDALGTDKTIKIYTSSHEQHACHAADGYSRATGRVGTVITTGGPGASNLVTGIANAYMDSVPLVAITGNVSLDKLGRDSFQEIDIAGVTMPVTKHNYIVKTVQELADTLREAYYYASSGRTGPILVDIPQNVFEDECEYIPAKPKPVKKKQPDFDDIKRAKLLIDNSKRPFVCAGGGVVSAKAHNNLYKFVQKLKCPVGLTAMGIGAYPRDDGLCTGVLGMKIPQSAKEALKECDLFLGIGLRFSEKIIANINEFAPNAKILHIDADKAEIGKNTSVDGFVCSDVNCALGELNKIIKDKESGFDLTAFENKTKSDSFIINALNEVLPGAIYTTEVGRHQLTACEGLRINKPGRFITSGGLGAMGFGLGAAIGAAVGTGKRIVNIAGDGSFNMNLGEIMTAVRYNLPVIQVVFHNHRLGMISDWQDRKYGKRHLEDKTPYADYAALAKALGADGVRVDNEKDLISALKKAKKRKSPTVIDVEIPDKDERKIL